MLVVNIDFMMIDDLKNLHFVVEDKILNELFNIIGLYKDEKSVDIGPTKVVGIYIKGLNGNIKQNFDC